MVIRTPATFFLMKIHRHRQRPQADETSQNGSSSATTAVTNPWPTGFDGQRLPEEEREKLRLAGQWNLFLGARAGKGVGLGEGAKAAR